jgi:hypothetical protein
MVNQFYWLAANAQMISEEQDICTGGFSRELIA